jgi:hypothetical protein
MRRYCRPTGKIKMKNFNRPGSVRKAFALALAAVGMTVSMTAALAADPGITDTQTQDVEADTGIFLGHSVLWSN